MRSVEALPTGVKERRTEARSASRENFIERAPTILRVASIAIYRALRLGWPYEMRQVRRQIAGPLFVVFNFERCRMQSMTWQLEPFFKPRRPTGLDEFEIEQIGRA